jgi:DNA-binding transcriptional MerR regulator
MRSGELARIGGISVDTLHHYESLGLLPPPVRNGNRYRQYPPEAAHRLRIIRNALAVGFSLKEIGAILKLRDQGGIPCHEVRRLAEEKVHGISDRIAELTTYRDHLRRVLQEWDQRLEQTGKQQRAYLLEALAAPPPRPKGRL